MDDLPRGWYHFCAVTAKPAEFPSDVVRAEQAARVGAMFERWAAEDVSDEPEWDIDQREVRGDDPGCRDADRVRQRQALDERRAVRRDPEQRQQSRADCEEERVREQEPDHDGSLIRAT